MNGSIIISLILIQVEAWLLLSTKHINSLLAPYYHTLLLTYLLFIRPDIKGSTTNKKYIQIFFHSIWRNKRGFSLYHYGICPRVWWIPFILSCNTPINNLIDSQGLIAINRCSISGICSCLSGQFSYLSL
jgi:hypothetical protein